MSKAEGRNVIIKFTDDLVGDVSDNINAFTVTGKEYQWVDGPGNNGPLLDKEYQIDKVERYGVVPIWNLGSELQLKKETVVAITELWDGTFIDGQYLSGCNWHPSAGVRTTNAIPVTGGKVYKFSGGNRTRIRWNDSNGTCIGSADLGSTSSEVQATAPTSAVSVFYYYTNAPSTTPPPSVIGEGETYEYATLKVYTSDVIQNDGEYRIRWLEDKPTNTDVLIEYTTGSTQGTWIEISNGEVINADTNLWFRVTLETTDTSITPILQDLWIEEPDAPQDKIRIVFDDYSRFPSVVGDLTVEYDATVGNLAGSGGAVESFVETFTPTDLVPEPNPGISETITVAPVLLTVDLLPVEYVNRFTEDTITIAPVELTVELIHISIINP